MGWIRVEDRLPEQTGDYIVAFYYCNRPEMKLAVDAAYYTEWQTFVNYPGADEYEVTGEVYAWMPFPSVGNIGWISVEEMLPAPGAEYLIRFTSDVYPDGRVDMAFYGKDGEWILIDYSGETVTHWMPRPSAGELNDERMLRSCIDGRAK